MSYDPNQPCQGCSEITNGTAACIGVCQGLMCQEDVDARAGLWQQLIHAHATEEVDAATDSPTDAQGVVVTGHTPDETGRRRPRLIDWEFWLLQPVSRDGKALLFYADGTVRFMHRCDRGERGEVICAPALKPGHQLNGVVQSPTDAERLTITPSILCPDCGTHGFVTNGRWEAL